MRLSAEQIEAIKRKSEHFFGDRAGMWLFGSPADNRQHGFTLIELTMTIIIVGILAVAVAPRFFDNSAFQARGFADQVQASLRYAQKQAIAQRRNVCVELAANKISLTIANAAGAAVACTANLNFPAGTNFIDAPSGVTLTSAPVAPPVSFSFDALGGTATAQTISVSGATNNVVVENGTGYVHSP